MPDVPWRRGDGQLRILVHLDGHPDEEQAPSRTELFLSWLDDRVPGWDDGLALVAAGLFVLLIGVLVTLL